MPDQPSVIVEREGGLAIVRLNRPHVINALDAGMADRLCAVIEGLAVENSLRALVLRGEGRGFCAGGDVGGFSDEADALQALDFLIRRFHGAVETLVALPVPTVAILHGAVAGAGLSLSLACDFAIAADNTKFTLAYARIGTTPDGGSSWVLPRLVGTRKAMEIACLSEMFGAEEALRLGLVTRVVPADRVGDEGMAFARKLAAGPTAALARTKALIQGAGSASLAEQLEKEREAFLASARTQDFAEGRAAFLGKHPPVFEGR